MKLSAEGRNRWLMSGDLDLAAVPEVWQQLVNLICVPGPMVLSLEGVQQSSSAGLAVLLQALQVAKQHQCELKFVQMPEDLLALARMSNVSQILGVEQ